MSMNPSLLGRVVDRLDQVLRPICSQAKQLLEKKINLSHLDSAESKFATMRTAIRAHAKAVKGYWALVSEHEEQFKKLDDAQQQELQLLKERQLKERTTMRDKQNVIANKEKETLLAEKKRIESSLGIKFERSISQRHPFNRKISDMIDGVHNGIEGGGWRNETPCSLPYATVDKDIYISFDDDVVKKLLDNTSRHLGPVTTKVNELITSIGEGTTAIYTCDDVEKLPAMLVDLNKRKRELKKFVISGSFGGESTEDAETAAYMVDLELPEPINRRHR